MIRTLQDRAGWTGMRNAKEINAGFRTMLDSNLKRVPAIAKKCVLISQKVAYYCRLVPLYENRDSGRVENVQWPRSILHYLALSIFVVSGVHKTLVTATYLMQHQLQLETVICGLMFLSYFNALATVAGNFLEARNVVDMLNLLEQPLVAIGKLKCKTVTVYDDVSASMRMISDLVMVSEFSLLVSLLSFFFKALPIFIVPALMEAGLITEDGLPGGAFWRLAFYPLELLAFAAPVSMALFFVQLVELAIGLAKVSMTELR